MDDQALRRTGSGGGGRSRETGRREELGLLYTFMLLSYMIPTHIAVNFDPPVFDG